MTLAPGDRKTQLEYMLGQCEDFSHRFSMWEKDFIESLREQFDRRSDLSEKQVEVLERIYCEKVP